MYLENRYLYILDNKLQQGNSFVYTLNIQNIIRDSMVYVETYTSMSLGGTV